MAGSAHAHALASRMHTLYTSRAAVGCTRACTLDVGTYVWVFGSMYSAPGPHARGKAGWVHAGVSLGSCRVPARVEVVKHPHAIMSSKGA